MTLSELLLILKEYGVVASTSIIIIVSLSAYISPKIISTTRSGFKLWKKFVKLLSITEQFEPNGGGSLVDKIGALHRDVKENFAVLDGKGNAILSFIGDNNQSAFFEADLLGRYTFVTRQWTDLIGLTPEDSMGYGWINAIDEKEQDRVLHEWKKAIDQKREFRLEFNLRCVQTNESIRVKCSTILIKDTDGEIIKYVGMVRPCKIP